MWIDYHLHTEYCHHARGRPEDFVRRALYLRMEEIGFSEHAPWMMGADTHPLAPTDAEWAAYMSEIERLRAAARDQNAPLKIRLGIELDYTPNQASRARAFLDSNVFDYVIGSVHAVTRPGQPVEKVWFEVKNNPRLFFELYFAQVRQMLEENCIDVIGHLDLPKREGALPADGYMDLFEDLLGVIRESGVVVELNTSGRDRPIREFYPSPAIVRRLAESGVPFTLGSDAHCPQDMGRYFHEAIETLREAGVKELITFEGRKRIGKKI